MNPDPKSDFKLEPDQYRTKTDPKRLGQAWFSLRELDKKYYFIFKLPGVLC